MGYVKSFYGIRVKTIDYSAVFGYINKKEKTIMIKLLEMKEKRDEDE